MTAQRIFRTTLAASLLCAALLSASPIHAALPGVPQHEAFVVTKVDANPDIAVRKVSFVRSNHIVLVGISSCRPASMRPSATKRLLSFIPRGASKSSPPGFTPISSPKKAL